MLETTPAQLSVLARGRQNALAGWVRERNADAELIASLLAASGDPAPDGMPADAPELLERVIQGDLHALFASGVGVAGMNERVHELGGEMDFQSSDTGTTIAVTLPIGRGDGETPALD